MNELWACATPWMCLRDIMKSKRQRDDTIFIKVNI